MNHPLLNVLVVVGVATLGFVLSWVVRGRSRELEKQDSGPWSAALSYIATAFGVVVGFSILLMFGQFADARAAVGDEATSVGTAFEQAALFPGAGRGIQQALVCYADMVVVHDWPAMRDGRGAAEVDAAFADLVQAVSQDDEPPVGALHAATATNLLAQVGNISTARETRLVAAEIGVPVMLWILMIGGGLFVLVLMFMVTLGATRRAQSGLVASAAAFTTVMVLLVAALANPFAEGPGRVSPRLIEEAGDTMRASPNSLGLEPCVTR